MGGTLLLDELHSEDLPEPALHDKLRWMNELQLDIPRRGGIISFRTKESQDVAKWAFSVHIAADPTIENCKRLFCMAHGEFVPAGCTASEHAYPYALIRDNQQRLLNFLNADENREITENFLQYSGISEYLKRDAADPAGLVRGTTYFYKQCYNILDNLFLMCQGCNANKGDGNPLSWFEGQSSYFGQPFIAHLESLGGLQEGILLPRIYNKNENYLHVQLSAQTQVMLPLAGIEAKALGIVVQDWFFDHYGTIFEEHRNFYVQNFVPLKAHLEYLGTLLISGKEEQFKQAVREQTKLRKNMKTLAAIQQSILKQRGLQVDLNILTALSGTSSSSEHSEVDEFNIKRTVDTCISERQISHATHRMRTIVRNLYGDEFVKPIYAYIKELCLRKPSLLGENWQNILAQLSDYLANFNGSEEVNNQLEQAIKTKISEWYENELGKLGVVRTQELQREHEEKMAQAKLLEQKDQEIAELRRIIEQQKASSPHSEQSPSGSPPSSKSSAFFPEGEKKRKREEEKDITLPLKKKN